MTGWNVLFRFNINTQQDFESLYVCVSQKVRLLLVARVGVFVDERGPN